MATELINRISIKKDGVYISTHSSNDTAPYHSVKINILTQAYLRGGQRELDRQIIDMCFSNCGLRGSHKSILPYKNAINIAINNEEFIRIRNDYNKLDDKAFYIANRMDEYKKLTKQEAEHVYENLQPELKKLRDKRNEYVVNIVEKERGKIMGSKELKNEILVDIVSLFMNENDRQALEKLYELTNDKLVKILMDWNKEYEEFIGEPSIYAGDMYEDVMSYVWDKYKLNEIEKTIDKEMILEDDEEENCQ